jgi:hypothetical protein
MRRIKSPECLGSDLPKERNLRALPSSSSADCRLAATWLRRWKAQECCETQVPVARVAPFLFIRKVLMQQFVLVPLATQRRTHMHNECARFS